MRNKHFFLVFCFPRWMPVLLFPQVSPLPFWLIFLFINFLNCFRHVGRQNYERGVDERHHGGCDSSWLSRDSNKPVNFAVVIYAGLDCQDKFGLQRVCWLEPEASSGEIRAHLWRGSEQKWRRAGVFRQNFEIIWSRKWSSIFGNVFYWPSHGKENIQCIAWSTGTACQGTNGIGDVVWRLVVIEAGDYQETYPWKADNPHQMEVDVLCAVLTSVVLAWLLDARRQCQADSSACFGLAWPAWAVSQAWLARQPACPALLPCYM